MSRPIRIGLIAEGEAELGPSIPYIKPEDGGKEIDKQSEGALHTLIRRELAEVGFEDCVFVQRHPSFKEIKTRKRRTGHSILDGKYLSQIVLPWKPDEIDLIVLVADADDIREERKKKLEKAIQIIQSSHLDEREQPINDQSLGGLAIRNFETWLLADTETVSRMLGVAMDETLNLEDSKETKLSLDHAIEESKYQSSRTIESNQNQRPLHIRWDLAEKLDIRIVGLKCSAGYGCFAQNLKAIALNAQQNIEELQPGNSQ